MGWIDEIKPSVLNQAAALKAVEAGLMKLGTLRYSPWPLNAAALPLTPMAPGAGQVAGSQVALWPAPE